MRRIIATLPLLLVMALSPDHSAVAQPPGPREGNEGEIMVNENDSVIIIDPVNKANIHGYVHIAFAWGTRLSPPASFLRGLINLKEAIITYTPLNATIDDHVYLNSPELHRMPFVFISTDRQFELTTQEQENLRNYFDGGGFVVLDNPIANAERSGPEASMKQMILDTLGSQVRFSPIPNDHELYHIFFDFNEGPPIGSEMRLFTTQSDVAPKGTSARTTVIPPMVHYLEGIYYKNRLAGIYSNKGYIVKWQEMGDNIPQLKMGVNMIVYALREGGIAQKSY